MDWKQYLLNICTVLTISQFFDFLKYLANTYILHNEDEIDNRTL